MKNNLQISTIKGDYNININTILIYQPDYNNLTLRLIQYIEGKVLDNLYTFKDKASLDKALKVLDIKSKRKANIENKPFLDKDGTHKDILFSDEHNSSPLEMATTYMALEILMPTDTFAREVLKHKGDVLKLAELFGVPAYCVIRRAKYLGYN